VGCSLKDPRIKARGRKDGLDRRGERSGIPWGKNGELGPGEKAGGRAPGAEA